MTFNCLICPASFCTEPPVGAATKRRDSGRGLPHTLGTVEGGRGGSRPYPLDGGPQLARKAALHVLGLAKVGRGTPTFSRGCMLDSRRMRRKATRGGELELGHGSSLLPV